MNKMRDELRTQIHFQRNLRVNHVRKISNKEDYKSALIEEQLIRYGAEKEVLEERYFNKDFEEEAKIEKLFAEPDPNDH